MICARTQSIRKYSTTIGTTTVQILLRDKEKLRSTTSNPDKSKEQEAGAEGLQSQRWHLQSLRGSNQAVGASQEGIGRTD